MFETLLNVFSSEDALLLYPNLEKTFDLRTDASSHAIGVVLSQSGHPITMISRTLLSTKENYATNERELLANVWALKHLKHYLYLGNKINIFDRSPNAISRKLINRLTVTNAIPLVKNPLNCFRNQLILNKGSEVTKVTKIMFKNRIRYNITYEEINDLIESVKTSINPQVVNAIYCDLLTLADI